MFTSEFPVERQLFVVSNDSVVNYSSNTVKDTILIQYTHTKFSNTIPKDIPMDTLNGHRRLSVLGHSV